MIRTPINRLHTTTAAGLMLLCAIFGSMNAHADLQSDLDAYFNDTTRLFQVSGDDLIFSHEWDNVDLVLDQYNIDIELKNMMFETAGSDALSELDLETFQSFIGQLETTYTDLYEIINNDGIIVDPPQPGDLPDTGPLPQDPPMTSIPEPATLAMCILGLGLIRHRSARQSNRV